MSEIKQKSISSRIILDYLLEHKLKIILALIMMIVSAAATLDYMPGWLDQH